MKRQTQNPMKITIQNPEIASLAGEWCNEQFGNDGWDLWAQDLLSGYPKYKFEFFKEQDLILFSLRWSEYV